jgi:predicted extracellular nuclease
MPRRRHYDRIDSTASQDCVAASVALKGDIIGVVSSQNDDPFDTIAADLNDAAEEGSELYSVLDTVAIGSDAVRVGLIYRDDVVEPTDKTRTSTGAGETEFPLLHNSTFIYITDEFVRNVIITFKGKVIQDDVLFGTGSQTHRHSLW